MVTIPSMAFFTSTNSSSSTDAATADNCVLRVRRAAARQAAAALLFRALRRLAANCRREGAPVALPSWPPVRMAMVSEQAGPRCPAEDLDLVYSSAS